MKKNTFRTVVVCLLIVVCAFSCGRNKIKSGLTVEERMKDAIRKFDDGDYLDVKTEFQIIILNYPGSSLSDKAQFYLAECHFKLKEYILASAEYQKLIRVYPNSDYVDDAQYKVALANFKLSPKYSLDQTNTEKTIVELQKFLEDYPNSELVKEANEMMAKCREKLAKKSYKSGVSYKKRSLYRSAVIYYEYVLDNYYDTSFAEIALFEKAECLKLLEDYEEAITFYQLFIEKYPENSRNEKIKNILAKFDKIKNTEDTEKETEK